MQVNHSVKRKARYNVKPYFAKRLFSEIGKPIRPLLLYEKGRAWGVFFSVIFYGIGPGVPSPLCRVGGAANEAGRVHDMYSHPTYPKILFVYEAPFVYELFSSTKRFVYEYSSTKGGEYDKHRMEQAA